MLIISSILSFECTIWTNEYGDYLNAVHLLECITEITDDAAGDVVAVRFLENNFGLNDYSYDDVGDILHTSPGIHGWDI